MINQTFSPLYKSRVPILVNSMNMHELRTQKINLAVKTRIWPRIEDSLAPEAERTLATLVKKKNIDSLSLWRAGSLHTAHIHTYTVEDRG